MREGVKPQMRVKEQIERDGEKREKDTIGEEMERCITEIETRAD